MFCYLLKIAAKRYKTDELLDTLHSFPEEFRCERGCLGYKIYRDIINPGSFTMFAEWKNYQDMQKHFQSNDFKILVGAARVLGASSELSITEIAPLNTAGEKGGHDE